MAQHQQPLDIILGQHLGRSVRGPIALQVIDMLLGVEQLAAQLGNFLGLGAVDFQQPARLAVKLCGHVLQAVIRLLQVLVSLFGYEHGYWPLIQFLTTRLNDTKL